jgi:hypothetical protein
VHDKFPPKKRAAKQRSYIVEEIRDHRLENGRYLFVVKWQGFPPSENTEEPMESFTKDMLRQYVEDNDATNEDKMDRALLPGLFD